MMLTLVVDLKEDIEICKRGYVCNPRVSLLEICYTMCLDGLKFHHAHCDTVVHSGIFCAASNAIEQCKTEGLVDVFQTTKAVRSSYKPGKLGLLHRVFVNLVCLSVQFHY